MITISRAYNPSIVTWPGSPYSDGPSVMKWPKYLNSRNSLNGITAAGHYNGSATGCWLDDQLYSQQYQSRGAETMGRHGSSDTQKGQRRPLMDDVVTRRLFDYK